MSNENNMVSKIYFFSCISDTDIFFQCYNLRCGGIDWHDPCTPEHCIHAAGMKMCYIVNGKICVSADHIDWHDPCTPEHCIHAADMEISDIVDGKELQIYFFKCSKLRCGDIDPHALHNCIHDDDRKTCYIVNGKICVSENRCNPTKHAVDMCYIIECKSADYKKCTPDKCSIEYRRASYPKPQFIKYRRPRHLRLVKREIIVYEDSS